MGRRSLERPAHIGGTSREHIVVSHYSIATNVIWREHIRIEPTNRGSPGSPVLKSPDPGSDQARLAAVLAVALQTPDELLTVLETWVRLDATSRDTLLRVARGLAPPS